jgi:hypothetical protein
MTDISQLVNFIQQKQITRLLYYYYLFQISKYFIVILTHARSVSLQMTALKRIFFFLGNI